MPCTEPCRVSGFPPVSIGTSTRNAASSSATLNRASSTTARSLARPARQLIAHRDREDHNQQSGDNEVRNLCPTVRP